MSGLNGNRAANDRMYRRYDPASFVPLTLVHEDGTATSEEPPAWFVQECLEAGNPHFQPTGEIDQRPIDEVARLANTDVETALRVVDALDRGRWAHIKGDPQSTGRRLRFVCASSIQPERTRWAWEPYVPLRALSLIAGPPGLGRSQLQVMMAAEATRGQLEGDLHGTPRPVLMPTAEDSLEATMVPRLIAAGADLDLIEFITISADGLIGALDVGRDLDELREKALEVRPVLITLDPLVSFIDGIDSHKDQQVRRVLGPLTALADEVEAGLNGLIHLNKRDGHDALNRVSGSIAFTVAARSVLLLGADRQDDDALHLVDAKSNLGKRGPSLGCRIEELHIDTAEGAAKTSRLLVVGETEARAEDLLAAVSSSDDRNAREDATDFLRQELAGGRRVRTVELQARAEKELGISVQTLRRAKKKLPAPMRLMIMMAPSVPRAFSP